MTGYAPFDEHLLRVDGDRLNVATAGQGDRGVLVVHGLLASHQELTPLIDGLARAGLRPVAPDLRGCGRSGGPRGHTSPERAYRDVRVVQGWMAEQGIDLVGAVGHSLGGAYLLYMASEGMAFPRLAIAATPATIRGELNPLEYVGYRLGGAVNAVWTTLGLPTLRAPYKVDIEDTIDDPDCREEAERWKFLQNTVPLTNVEPLLGVDAADWAGQVDTPTLVLAATNDRVVQRHATEQVYDALAGPKEWTEIPGGHSVFLDHGRDEALQATVDWLRGAE